MDHIEHVETAETGCVSAPAAALTVLFCDDEPDNLELFLQQFGRTYRVRTASSAAEALTVLAREDVALVITDERMPQTSGIELLNKVVEQWPDAVRVIVSAYGDAGRLLRAINHGHAHEYVLKPWDRTELAACIERCLAIARRRRDLVMRAARAGLAETEARAEYAAEQVVGAESGLKCALSLARRVARTDATVLVRGETGTGKEMVARLIHEHSARKDGPFVRVNCAALAEGVLESELFGHEKGAFTGANSLRRGRFELACGGTIFLDEIGDVSPKLQSSLLRVLQEREIERVGASAPVPVNVRVITATHRDLEGRVREGTFREDLFYRINVVPIVVPPVRARPEDVGPLVRHFLVKHAPPGRPPAFVSDATIARLSEYAWPGNVREIENLVQRAVILAVGSEITLEDFCLRLDIPEDLPVREAV
ncbi:MAG TPA: sigma-54 dependent transcriptional regulator, partial [Polyangiaceae bacterium]|nr:sigma-54 dependent transcriptional regulator [Polyangiaceae bacterium]